MKKKVKKFKKGFTLFEMIATVSILGVVSVAALPVINNISDSITLKKFESYEDSLTYAAKLYTDQYEADMFGGADKGCYTVPFFELTNTELIKDIELDKATCASPYTFVIVRKNGTNFDYDVSIQCALNNEVVYDHGKAFDEDCPKPDDPTPLPPSPIPWKKPTCPAGKTCLPHPVTFTGSNISSNPKESSIPSKKQNVKILVGNEKGFAPNAKIRYYWINASNNSVIGSKTEHDFKNALIKNSVTLSFDVTTPTVSNEIKLVVEPVYVINSEGTQIVEKYTSGVFKIDNTPPTIVIKAYQESGGNKTGGILKQTTNADLSITDWRKFGYYFDFSTSSDNYGIVKQTWKWNKSGTAVLNKSFSGGSTNDTKVANKTLTTVGARYANVEMCDKAGNCSNRNIQVNLSTKYTVNYSANGGTGNTNPTTCYYGFDCSLANSGFTKVDYKFTKWNIDGKDYIAGANFKNMTTVNGKVYTAKAQWQLNAYDVILKGNGVADPPSVKKIHDKTLYLPTPTRSGYKFIGWNASPNSHSSGYGTTFTENNGKTLYAIWRKNDPYRIYYKPDKATWFADYSGSECYVYNKETSCSVKLDNVPRCGDNCRSSISSNYKYDTLFDFRGWHTSTGQVDAQYNQGATVTLSSNLTVYAVVVLNNDKKKMRVTNCSEYDSDGYYRHIGLKMRYEPFSNSGNDYVMRDGATLIARNRLAWSYSGGHVWIYGHMSSSDGCNIDTYDWPEYGKVGPSSSSIWGITYLNGRGWYTHCACFISPGNWNTSGSGDCYSKYYWSTAQWMTPV